MDMRTMNARQPGRGKVDQVVRSIDIAPTLLELAGATPAASMEGVSLACCLRQQMFCPQLDAFNETGIWIADIPGLPDTHLRYPDLLELMEVPNRESGTLAIKPDYGDITLTAKDRMMRRGRWKLTYQPLSNGHFLQLFDVVADPMCKQNLIDQHADIADTLWQQLRVWVGRVIAVQDKP